MTKLKKISLGFAGAMIVVLLSFAAMCGFNLERMYYYGMVIAAAAGVDNHVKAYGECQDKAVKILDEVNALQGSLVTKDQAQLKSSDPLFQKAVELWYLDKYAPEPYDPVFKQCMIARGHDWYKEIDLTYKRP